MIKIYTCVQEHCYQWSLQAASSTFDRLEWKGGGFGGAVTIIWDRSRRAAASPTLATSTPAIDQLRGKRKRSPAPCACGVGKCDSLQEKIGTILQKRQKYTKAKRALNATALAKENPRKRRRLKKQAMVYDQICAWRLQSEEGSKQTPPTKSGSVNELHFDPALLEYLKAKGSKRIPMCIPKKEATDAKLKYPEQHVCGDSLLIIPTRTTDQVKNLLRARHAASSTTSGAPIPETAPLGQLTQNAQTVMGKQTLMSRQNKHNNDPYVAGLENMASELAEKNAKLKAENARIQTQLKEEKKRLEVKLEAGIRAFSKVIHTYIHTYKHAY